MKERGLLVRTEGGVNISMLMIDPTSFVDVMNPKAREFMWAQIKKNYVSRGIRAFWLAVQFIKNAQRTQHEKAEVPVIPFALNDYSATEPTEFSFIYTLDNIKYWYSFAATRDKIFSESLYYAPKGQKAMVFSRKGQKFTFTADKARRKLIGETVAKNQLYFSQYLLTCIGQF